MTSSDEPQEAEETAGEHEIELDPTSLASEEEIADFVERVPSEPIHDDKLGAMAEKTEARGTETRTLVDRIRAHLRDESIGDRIRKFQIPPAYQEVFAGAFVQDEKNWFVQSVEWFKNEVHKFASGNFDPATIDQAIIRLQAQMVFFSAYVNHLDGVSTDAESTAKQARNRAFLEVREMLEREDISVRQASNELVGALAEESIQDRLSYHSTTNVAAMTVKGFYYALKDFIAYLDRASQRAHGERFGRKGQ